MASQSIKVRACALALLCGCATGRWVSVPAERPAARAELLALKVSVADPRLREAMAAAGFTAVQRLPYESELQLELKGEEATLRSDGFFVDQVHGSPAEIARALAVSSRVAEFIRNSGTIEQRSLSSQ